MSCDRSIQIHRYHDDELSAAERQEVQAHLGGCSDCRELLSGLQSLSARVCRAAVADLPAGLIDRMQRMRSKGEERAVLRIAGWMTAMAACIMIATILSWPANRVDAAAPAEWQIVAATPVSDITDGPGGEMVVLAQWMADELATSRNGELR